MPRETVAVGSSGIDNATVAPEHHPAGAVLHNRRAWALAVSWHKDDAMPGWAQASMIPEGWESTGDWKIVDLGPDEIDHLIRVLKRVKRQAFPRRG